MELTTLIETIKQTAVTKLPFSVIHCRREQRLHSVPIFKPTLVFVLQGEKGIGQEQTVRCHDGHFMFFPRGQDALLSNRPINGEYLALTLELQAEDFQGLNSASAGNSGFFMGEMDGLLIMSLQQMLGFSQLAPKTSWGIRRQEIIQILINQGHRQILSAYSDHSLSHKISQTLQSQPDKNWTVPALSQSLAMSEATLRRRLQNENTSFRQLLESCRLGLGLDLLQTTQLPIALIAERCGYQSPSRFAERFKQRFQLTPSQLRRTQEPA